MVTVRDDVATAPRFLLVGTLAVIIDASVYAALTGPIGPGAAKAAGYASGAVFGYVANWKFTFGTRRGAWTEIAFVVTYALSLALNVGVNALVLAVVPGVVGKVVAFLAATGASTVWNYIGLSRFVFKRRSTASREPS